MKKLLGGITTFVLVAVLSGVMFAADPPIPSKGDKITPATKPLLSPEKAKELKKQTERNPGITPVPSTHLGLGFISGTIQVFDSPRYGCSSVRFQLMDNDIAVPPSNLSLTKNGSSSPDATDYEYKISNLRLGVHIISMKTAGECAGFQWSPNNQRIEVASPDHLRIEGINFVYKSERTKFKMPRKPIK